MTRPIDPDEAPYAVIPLIPDAERAFVEWNQPSFVVFYPAFLPRALDRFTDAGRFVDAAALGWAVRREGFAASPLPTDAFSMPMRFTTLVDALECGVANNLTTDIVPCLSAPTL